MFIRGLLEFFFGDMKVKIFSWTSKGGDIFVGSGFSEFLKGKTYF